MRHFKEETMAIKEKESFKQWINKMVKSKFVFNFLTFFIIPLITSTIFEFAIKPRLEKITPVNIFSLKVNLFGFNVSLITLIIFIVTFCLAFFFTTKLYKNTVETQKIFKQTKKELEIKKKEIKEKESTIIELKEQNKTLSNEITNLENEIRSPLNKLLSVLKQYIDENDVVDSTQLFSIDYPSHDVDQYSSKIISVRVDFVGGFARNNSNALLLMNYYFESDIYYKLKELFDLRKKYFDDSSIGKTKNNNAFEEIQTKAIELTNILENKLNKVSSIDHVDEIHYSYYRMLEVLSNVVLFKYRATECKRLLSCSEDIETHLKTAHRNGILGTFFTKSMYCFYNENSCIKKNRMYFSIILTCPSNELDKPNHYIILVAVDKKALRTGQGRDELECCKMLCNNLTKKLSEVKLNETNIK